MPWVAARRGSVCVCGYQGPLCTHLHTEGTERRASRSLRPTPPHVCVHTFILRVRRDAPPAPYVLHRPTSGGPRGTPPEDVHCPGGLWLNLSPIEPVLSNATSRVLPRCTQHRDIRQVGFQLVLFISKGKTTLLYFRGF